MAAEYIVKEKSNRQCGQRERAKSKTAATQPMAASGIESSKTSGRRRREQRSAAAKAVDNARMVGWWTANWRMAVAAARAKTRHGTWTKTRQRRKHHIVSIAARMASGEKRKRGGARAGISHAHGSVTGVRNNAHIGGRTAASKAKT